MCSNFLTGDLQWHAFFLGGDSEGCNLLLGIGVQRWVMFHQLGTGGGLEARPAWSTQCSPAGSLLPKPVPAKLVLHTNLGHEPPFRICLESYSGLKTQLRFLWNFQGFINSSPKPDGSHGEPCSSLRTLGMCTNTARSGPCWAQHPGFPPMPLAGLSS